MTVYGAPRRGRDPLPIAVVVLALGVLTGAALLLWSRTGPDDGVRDASLAGASSSAEPSGPAAPPSPSAPPSSAAPSPSRPPPSSTPPGNVYQAVRGTGSGLCLDVSPAEPGAGGRIVVNACAGTPGQRWLHTADEALVNGATGLCLAVAGASFGEAGRVQQDPCTGTTNQRWRAMAVGGGANALVAAHSGRCLDAPGATAGTPVVQVTCANAPTQGWALVA